MEEFSKGKAVHDDLQKVSTERRADLAEETNLKKFSVVQHEWKPKNHSQQSPNSRKGTRNNKTTVNCKAMERKILQ